MCSSFAYSSSSRPNIHPSFTNNAHNLTSLRRTRQPVDKNRKPYRQSNITYPTWSNKTTRAMVFSSIHVVENMLPKGKTFDAPINHSNLSPLLNTTSVHSQRSNRKQPHVYPLVLPTFPSNRLLFHGDTPASHASYIVPAFEARLLRNPLRSRHRGSFRLLAS